MTNYAELLKGYKKDVEKELNVKIDMDMKKTCEDLKIENKDFDYCTAKINGVTVTAENVDKEEENTSKNDAKDTKKENTSKNDAKDVDYEEVKTDTAKETVKTDAKTTAAKETVKTDAKTTAAKETFSKNHVPTDEEIDTATIPTFVKDILKKNKNLKKDKKVKNDVKTTTAKETVKNDDKTTTAKETVKNDDKTTTAKETVKNDAKTTTAKETVKNDAKTTTDKGDVKTTTAKDDVKTNAGKHVNTHKKDSVKKTTKTENEKSKFVSKENTSKLNPNKTFSMAEKFKKDLANDPEQKKIFVKRIEEIKSSSVLSKDKETEKEIVSVIVEMNKNFSSNFAIEDETCLKNFVKNEFNFKAKHTKALFKNGCFMLLNTLKDETLFECYFIDEKSNLKIVSFSLNPKTNKYRYVDTLFFNYINKNYQKESEK